MEIGWEKISENGTSVESTTAKRTQSTLWSESREHCQVLGPGTKHVMNAHIWPHNNMENLPLIDLVATDIDNPKNAVSIPTLSTSSTDFSSLLFRLVMALFSKSWIRRSKVLPSKIPMSLLKTSTDVRFISSGNRPWRRILGTHSGASQS
jgi:hypothetical protein